MTQYRLQEFDRLRLQVPKERLGEVLDPQSDQAFVSSKLVWSEIGNEPHRSVLASYRSALALRRELYVADNTDRTRWKVKAMGGVVILSYAMRDHVIEVQFAVKTGEYLRLPPDGEIICDRAVRRPVRPRP